MAGKDKKGVVEVKEPVSETPVAEEAQSTIVSEITSEEVTEKATEETKETPVAEEAEPAAVNDQADATNDSTTDPIVEPTKHAVEDQKVIVIVPKAFRLTLPLGVVRKFEAGVQTVEKSIADHWYAKANGMKIFNPDA